MKHKSKYYKVAPGIWGMKILFVNIYMIASDGHWVLVDAGLAGSAGRILRMADDLFNGVPPSAIVLTHGHFDHRGALPALLKTWDAPVYAHRLELPYLTGKSAYPPPDPTVGGGLMSVLSFLYPKQPIDLGSRVHALPVDGNIPFLPGWKTVHVPGHAPGQVALFRSSDKTVIAGDTFVTTKQESAVFALSALPFLSGPPKYFTYDWDAAKTSVKRLKDLMPKKAATGHGLPMYGHSLKSGLEKLIKNFDKVARPKHGRYVKSPALTDEHGVVLLPPQQTLPIVTALMGILVIGLYAGLKIIRTNE